MNLGKQTLESGVQVMDNVSRREDVKVTVKRCAVEGANKMGKKNINRAPARKTVNRKRTVTGRRLTHGKKKKVSTNLL